MLRSKNIDRICCAMLAVMLVLTTVLWGTAGTAEGEEKRLLGYEDRLFDRSTVHTLDIEADDWDSLIENALQEEYIACNVVIDGERYNNVAIRTKGNTSLSSVANLNSTRYSFKIEFDHYAEGMTYHGLDKLSLNNLIQDSTMMKDYLAYTLMNRMDVPAPLCSYVQINVNGTPWGLYLAVEGIEDGFLQRNTMTKGELYKPDSMSFGGGRGNGGGFDMDKFRSEDAEKTEEAQTTQNTEPENPFGGSFGGPNGNFEGFAGAPSGTFGGFSGAPGGEAGSFQSPEDGTMPQMPGAGEMPGDFGGFNFGMGNDDVKLIYSDDDPDSYANIFDNAKTKVSKKDKARLIEALRKLNAGEDIADTVDTDEVTRYLAVHNFLCNDDSYTGMMVHNYYLYEENGKLSIIPWDYNLGFGGFSAAANATSAVNTTIDSPVSGGTVESRPLIAWIFSDEEALAHYHKIYDAFLTDSIESGWLEQEINRVREMITPYVEKDASAFYDMEEFSKGVETMRIFCAKRGQSVRGQLDGTIASTTTDRQQNSTVVDASEISTADMGSMNGMNGGGFGPAQAVPGEAAGRNPDSAPNGGFNGTTGDVPNGGPNGAPNGMPSGAPGGMPSGAPNGMPSGAPNGMPSSAPGGMPENGSFSPSSGQQSENRPTQTPPETAEAPSTAPNPGRTMPTGGFTPPNNIPGDAQPENVNWSGWITAGICLIVLLAALAVSKYARPHN